VTAEASHISGASLPKCVRGFGVERDNVEKLLATNGVVLPLPQRAAWIRVSPAFDTLLLVQNEASTGRVSACGLEKLKTRIIPGHHIMRVQRYSGGQSAGADASLLLHLARVAREDRRCLRAVVEVFERDPEARARLRDALKAASFVRTSSRMYARTLALELEGSDEEILAKLSKSARSNIRAPAKRGLKLQVIDDPAYAGRIESLMTESFEHTKSRAPSQAWKNIIELSAQAPTTSRVVGLFDPTLSGPEALLSVAWGCAHGAYASYEAGAMARSAKRSNTPLGYAPLWDLIVWARRETSATWFDLGGVSSGDEDDVTAGISGFKQYFSKQVVDVGEEWQLEPHPKRAMLARVVRRVLRLTQTRSRL
jgi:hypothetical protein